MLIQCLEWQHTSHQLPCVTYYTAKIHISRFKTLTINLNCSHCLKCQTFQTKWYTALASRIGKYSVFHSLTAPHWLPLFATFSPRHFKEVITLGQVAGTWLIPVSSLKRISLCVLYVRTQPAFVSWNVVTDWYVKSFFKTIIKKFAT